MELTEQKGKIGPVRGYPAEGTASAGQERLSFNGVDKKVVDEILNFIQQINYGEVVVTIHDSKIVQVEKREKKRFQK